MGLAGQTRWVARRSPRSDAGRGRAVGAGTAGTPRRRRAPLDALPPPALILVGIVSVQVGAGLAKQLFAVLSPAGVTLLRLWSSAIVLLLVTAPAMWRGRRRMSTAARPRTAVPVRGGGPRQPPDAPPAAPARADGPRDRPETPRVPAPGGELRDRRARARWRSLCVAVVFGFTLAAMNLAIYQAFARIPLGVAVTIEFLGPLAVAVAASRRLLDLIWITLAGGGVLLLTRAGHASPATSGHVMAVGVIFALVSAGCWAAYIMLAAATGRRFPGSTGLVIAMVVAAVVVTPVGITSGGSALLRPDLLAAGTGIGLLSSVIPYSLELAALRRLPPKVFSILMSLEPAVAALVGLALLGQVLMAREWLAIGCVMVACIGATRR